MKVIFALVVALGVHALTVHAGVFSHSRAGNDIESLCARKEIDLTTFSQLRELAASAQNCATCSPEIRQALTELVALIEQGAQDLCSVESIERLRHYYLSRLDSSKTAVEHEKLPKSLRRFVLAYGLQMSNKCKHNMLDELLEEGHKLLTPEDFSQIGRLVDDDSPVAQMLGTLAGPDAVFLPGDLVPLMKGNGLKNDKLFLQTATGAYIKNLQQICTRRFKPVYGPLMMPLVQLSNLGFSYKDEPLRCKFECSTVVREISRWSRIVFMCEALNGIHIVEDPQDKQLAEGTGSKLVRIITAEEAAAIEGARDEQQEGDAQVELVVYEPKTPVTLDDLIYDKSDAQLHKAIKAFKTNKSEAEIVKKRLMSKGLSMIKQEVREGNYKLLVSATYKGVLQRVKGGQYMDPNQELVRVLDDVVAASSENRSVDGPVSKDHQTRGAIVGVAIIIFWLALFAAMGYVLFLAFG